jgi:hypothetical protein
MIRIFNVRSSAVYRDFDPGVLHILGAKLLHKAKTNGSENKKYAGARSMSDQA